jgi:hypothetical protein
MLETINAADFLPNLNNEFRIYFDPALPSPAELIEVSEINSSSTDGGRKSFSIVFRGAKEKVWPQGMYKIEHPRLGELQLFLVPIGPDNEGMCYEAVFN